MQQNDTGGTGRVATCLSEKSYLMDEKM